MSDKRELSSLIRLFICTDRMHKAYVDRFISELGIHRSQHMILMYLARCEKTPSQKELAQHFDVSPAVGRLLFVLLSFLRTRNRLF